MDSCFRRLLAAKVSTVRFDLFRHASSSVSALIDGARLRYYEHSMNSPGPLCHRCLQPVTPTKAQKCPNCGTPLGPKNRTLAITIGTAGVLALVFVVWIMVKVMREDALMNAAPDGQEASQSAGR